MYCYLYDDFIQENKRFEKELLKIENRLTDLGIALRDHIRAGEAG